jgi:tyrosyl-tRNA synthetase
VTSLIEDLRWRGLVHQMTDEELLGELLDKERVVAYIGFDPTADSLHVGHLQQMVMLRRLQDAGHSPIALIGGGTGMIGDPGGRTEERNLLAPHTLQTNAAGIRKQLESFLGSENGVVVVDNNEWLGPARLLEFLRDVGKVFSVNEMVRKDSVRARLTGREQGLSFTEFSYMLLQAWDFLQLYDRYGCRLQLGGSDQWGNITEGVDLIRRKREAKAFGVTSPLVLKSDGSKFGKTESGSVWLDPGRTKPYHFYQFWLRTNDADVGDYLRRLTLLGREEITALDDETASRPERRAAQRALARTLTGMVHGPEEAERAAQAAQLLFSEDISGLGRDTLEDVLADAPSTAITPAELDGGLTVVSALVRTGLTASKGEARRKVAEGGVYLNNRRVAADGPLGAGDALHGRFVILRLGRAHQHVLHVLQGQPTG